MTETPLKQTKEGENKAYFTKASKKIENPLYM